MIKAICTFDEFIEAAIDNVGASRGDEAAFINGESLSVALRRWWGEVLQLRVTGPNVFEWRCPGCQALVTAAKDHLHELPMFDYLLWEHCPSCASALAGTEE